VSDVWSRPSARSLEPLPGLVGAHTDGIELVGPPRDEGRQPRAAVPPDDDRRVGSLDPLWREGDGFEPVVVARECERVLREQGVHDLELLGQHVEPLAVGREREPVRLVFLLPPAGPHADLDATVADPIDRDRAFREDSRKPERHRRHERAEADRGGDGGEAGEVGPGVGGPALTVPHHAEVMVRGEDRIEPEPLGMRGGGHPLGPGDALLAFEHEAETHERVA
jgi:hypothetical protein